MKQCRDCGCEIAAHRRVCGPCKLAADMAFVARRLQARISREVRAAVLERDGMVCRHCGRTVRFGRGGMRDKAPEILSFDHFPLPVSRGGKGGIDNVVVACMECNQRRGDRF